MRLPDGVGMHDEGTGEVLSKGQKLRYAYMDKANFVTVGVAEAGLLARVHLSALEWQVFWYAFSCCENDNWTPFVAADIADDLQCTPSAVSRALAKLVAVGLLLRSERPEARRYHRYRLNPAHFFRGSAFRHRKVLAETGARPVLPML